MSANVTLQLTQEEVEYLSVLVAQDLREDDARGLSGVVERHTPVWAKLAQAANREAA